jgi:hypothetical protein
MGRAFTNPMPAPLIVDVQGESMVIALAAAGSARWAQVTVVLLAPHAATQAAGPTEPDWIRWTGVLITAVGTLVAAPSGVARLYRAVAGTLAVIWWILKLVFSKKARAGLGRGVGTFFKFLGAVMLGALAQQKPEPPATPGPIQIRWEEGASFEEKLEGLRKELERAFKEISDARREAQSADAELQKSLGQLSDDLQKAKADLYSRMDAAEKQAAAIDSRGILLLGAGVILTGIPDELAHFAWLGWAAVGISVFVMFCVLLAMWLGRSKRSPAAAAAA